MRKSSISIVFLLGLLLRSLSAKSKEEPLAPALYAFGDSLVDSGNNNGLPTLNKVNYMPYGVDFVNGPTGRFTNGKTVVDFIAQMLGLPFAPPYLGLSRAQRSQIITGVNYASGAAGILPESGRRMGECISLKEQVDYFQRTVEMDLARIFKDLETISDHLSKSIFFVSIGSNDYINNYLQPDYYNTSRQYSSQKFAGFLMHHLSEQLKKLYKLGARKMVIFEIGILGCIPSFTNANNSNGTCVEEVNKFVFEYNRLLPVLLKKLKSDLSGSFFIHGQAFDSGLNVYQNPSKYGKKKILTIDNLKKKGMILPNICLCCMRSEETVDHLLLHCRFVHSIWAEFMYSFNISWCFPATADLFLLAWHGTHLGKSKTTIWRMAILAVWWSVWGERNNRCFRNISNTAQSVASSAKRVLNIRISRAASSTTMRPNYAFPVKHHARTGTNIFSGIHFIQHKLQMPRQLLDASTSRPHALR